MYMYVKAFESVSVNAKVPQLKHTHSDSETQQPVSMAKHVSFLSLRSARLLDALSGFQTRLQKAQFQVLQLRPISRQSQLHSGTENNRYV